MLMGAAGFTYHLTEWNAQQPLHYGFVWVELLRLVAILCGAFMLRGHNWARWLTIAWIGYHVILSAFHTPSELALHALLCATIAYLLFRSTASRYFRDARTQAMQA